MSSSSSSSSSSVDRDTIRSTLYSNLRTVVRNVPEEITESNSLIADFGADSLQVVEVVSRTMRQLRIRIPRTAMVGARNIHDLIDLFEQASA